MTDVSTAPASDMDSPGDNDAADAVGGAGMPDSADS
jgi:hypothetical protein